MSLLPDELNRYARHVSLPQVGVNGQKKLKSARVLCVGAGGLGCPVLLYLASAGVGNIGIIDGDKVEISNLQRQVLYDSDQIGLNKVEAAKVKLTRNNPHINIQTYPIKLTAYNALSIIAQYDYIIDCTDNFTARYLINDACYHLKKPNASASVSQFEGYCSVFCTIDGPCYRCLFPDSPPEFLIPNCSERGVLGVLPGILGVIQANEVIKMILNIGNPLIGRLLVVDTLTMTFKSLQLNKNEQCPLCSHQKTYFDLCSIVTGDDTIPGEPQGISVTKLKELLSINHVNLLDVRQLHESQRFNLGGRSIPLQELNHRMHEIEKNKPLIVYCESDVRSKQAAQLLMQTGFTNISYLTGGIQAWIHHNE